MSDEQQTTRREQARVQLMRQLSQRHLNGPTRAAAAAAAADAAVGASQEGSEEQQQRTTTVRPPPLLINSHEHSVLARNDEDEDDEGGVKTPMPALSEPRMEGPHGDDGEGQLDPTRTRSSHDSQTSSPPPGPRVRRDTSLNVGGGTFGALMSDPDDYDDTDDDGGGSSYGHPAHSTAARSGALFVTRERGSSASSTLPLIGSSHHLELQSSPTYPAELGTSSSSYGYGTSMGRRHSSFAALQNTHHHRRSSTASALGTVPGSPLLGGTGDDDDDNDGGGVEPPVAAQVLAQRRPHLSPRRASTNSLVRERPPSDQRRPSGILLNHHRPGSPLGSSSSSPHRHASSSSSPFAANPSRLSAPRTGISPPQAPRRVSLAFTDPFKGTNLPPAPLSAVGPPSTSSGGKASPPASPVGNHTSLVFPQRRQSALAAPPTFARRRSSLLRFSESFNSPVPPSTSPAGSVTSSPRSYASSRLGSASSAVGSHRSRRASHDGTFAFAPPPVPQDRRRSWHRRPSSGLFLPPVTGASDSSESSAPQDPAAAAELEQATYARNQHRLRELRLAAKVERRFEDSLRRAALSDSPVIAADSPVVPSGQSSTWASPELGYTFPPRAIDGVAPEDTGEEHVDVEPEEDLWDEDEWEAEIERRIQHTGALPREDILGRLDSLLGVDDCADGEGANGEVLGAPPRKLKAHTGVFQVVNANTVKDRHLFLFNDLLVIAKPVLDAEVSPPSLHSSFLVKSIVELKDLKVAMIDNDADQQQREASSAPAKKHPLLVAFVDRFANDPKRAISSLVQRGGLTNDAPTIANLLFRNTDLNRNQLGAYLSAPEHKHLLRAYVERFRLGGVRIDDALRMFCMSMRLPSTAQEQEYVLHVLASIWTEANGTSGFDPSLSLSLILMTLRLSAQLHGDSLLSRESEPFSADTVEDWVAAFREHDPRLLVPEELLERIYDSVRRDKVERASDNSIFSMAPDIEASIAPARLPSRLTYRQPSEPITITIPEPDAKFGIKLHGQDLKFDPPVLSFARSNTASFRVSGNALGIRAMVLIKTGAHAPRYQGIPVNKAFSVERAFMQHTFQLTFVNHLDLKRKYLFSFSDGPTRTYWAQALKSRGVSASLPRARAVAEAVSTQVLRDVLIPPEAPPPSNMLTAGASPRVAAHAPRSAKPLTPTRTGTPTRVPGRLGLPRSNSFSKLYTVGIGKAETDLQVPDKASLTAPRHHGHVKQPKEELPAEYVKSGDEIVTTIEQNSLMPTVLAFLNAAAEAAPYPMSTHATAFQRLGLA